MRASEYVAMTYYVYFAAVCWLGRVPLARRVLITAVSLLMMATVTLVASLDTRLRDWAPAFYILVGYYLSGWIFVRPSKRIEAWLLSWDQRLLGDPTTRFSAWSPLVLAYLDLVYTLCFLLLPAGFAALVVAGRSDLADRYWTIVAASEFCAFMPLAFVQTRPPWVLERQADLPDGAVHRLASHAVRRVSIGVNTFPSGHAAGSVGLALALSGPLPWTGAVLLVLAGTIAIACVVGRYHYVVDVVAGIALALVVWMVSSAAGL
jgi:membrane-associated phospholipid phosphatase